MCVLVLVYQILPAAKVCDYGVSGELKNSMAQSNTGTCRYMAPERIDPSRSAGGGFRIQADVWSLGLTLLELATGKHPYESFVNQFELLKHVSHLRVFSTL